MGERARLRDIASGRRDALNVDPQLIKIQPDFNPRQYTLYENREHLDALKMSIAQVGVLVPLLVRWDSEQAVLIDGECRLRACLELIKEGTPIKTVPVLQETAGDDAERLVIALSANTGKPLSQLESGGAYRRLERFGWSFEDIATKVGVSVRHVKESVELANASSEVKEMVRKGEVTPTLARQVVRQKGDKAAEGLKEAVAKAKAAGKKKATATKAEGKKAKGLRFERDHAAALATLGDEMAKTIIGEGEYKETRLGRLALRWNKARGI